VTVNKRRVKQKIKDLAKEIFGQPHYTIMTTEWCDGDYKIEARHGSCSVSHTVERDDSHWRPQIRLNYSTADNSTNGFIIEEAYWNEDSWKGRLNREQTVGKSKVLKVEQ